MQRQVCVTKDYYIDYVDTSAGVSSKKRSCQPMNVVVKHVTVDGEGEGLLPLTALELAQILKMDAEGETSKTISNTH